MSDVPTAPEFSLPSLPSDKVNWTEAFTAYAGGATIAELAEAYNVPIPRISRIAEDQRWEMLAARMAGKLARTEGEESRLEKIQENREANLEVAVELRHTLIDWAKKMRQGKLLIEKAFLSKGLVVTTETHPGPADLAALATAAKGVADLTYRALGDVEGGRQGGPRSGDAGAITIVLPNIATAPQDAVAKAKEVEVIDLRDAQ